MDELVQALSRLAILPMAARQQEVVVESAATLRLHDTTAKQPEPAPSVAVGGNHNMTTKGPPNCGDTPQTGINSATTTTTTITITTTTVDDREPAIEQFPGRSATTRSKHSRDSVNLRNDMLKYNAERTCQKLQGDARRMQSYLEKCLRWLDHNKYIRDGMPEKFAAVTWLKYDLIGWLTLAGHLSAALVTWKPSNNDRLVTWTDILVVQAKMEARHDTTASVHRRPSCYL